MPDDYPLSTRHVERVLARAELITDDAYDRMTISTRTDTRHRAVTTVSRPVLRDANDQTEADRAVVAALRKLPGAEQGIPFAGVSQTWEVTWDGILRPA